VGANATAGPVASSNVIDRLSFAAKPVRVASSVAAPSAKLARLRNAGSTASDGGSTVTALLSPLSVPRQFVPTTGVTVQTQLPGGRSFSTQCVAVTVPAQSGKTLASACVEAS
jgi:hypothetical protein